MSYSPPPSQYQPPRRGSNGPLIVGLVVGCGLALLILVGLVGIVLALRVGSFRTMRRPLSSRFGGPMPEKIDAKAEKLQNLDQGWATYRFNALGYTADMPKQPFEEQINPREWDYDDQEGVESYAGMTTLYPNGRIVLEGYLYRVNFPRNDQWIVAGDLTKHHRSDYSDVKQTVRTRTVDGVPAIEVEDRFVYDSSPCEDYEIFIVGRRGVRSISFTCWTDQDQECRKDFERCVDSLKFLPEDEDTFGRRPAILPSVSGV